MVRKLSWLVALSALCCSMGAFALGLGDIQLHSALNQPLKADIDLHSVRSGEAEGINVSLGTVEEFARAGLERPYWLNKLRFLVVAKGKGQYRIHISTAEPLREPFVDFLIQVTWKGGQLLREYTVLLDPPVMLPAPVQVITAPVTKAVPAPAGASPQPTSATAPIPASAPSATTVDAYRVQRSDTLWGIANQTRPDASVSVEQMMQAMLRANPSAFIGDNINNLKAGQILRIPSSNEIDAISPQEALRATREQNEAWRNQRAVTAPATIPAEVAAAPAVEPAPAIEPKPPAEEKAPVTTPTPTVPDETTQAQLKVVAPTPVDDAKPDTAETEATTPSTAPTTATDVTDTDINKELALTTEAVETQRQETEELRTRLSDLEQQITTMQKLMAVKDEQLAAMQSKSTAAAPDRNAATGLLNNPATLAMIGIFAVIVAALFWLLLRQRQLGTSGMQPAGVRLEPRDVAAAPAGSNQPVPAVDAVTAGVAAAAAVRAASKTAVAAPQPEPVVEQAAERPPESDPLSEADIYLAYGRYQQAEELIKEAMQRDRSPALRFKLLEIYYAAKNATRFEDTARDLRHDIGADHELWQQVLPMGRELCPYSLLFNADQSGEQVDLSTADTTAEPSPPSATVPDSYDFAPSAQPTGQDRIEREPALDFSDESTDEVGTKLDLARAYIDMGDSEGARSILAEVLEEGNMQQKTEAQELLGSIAR